MHGPGQGRVAVQVGRFGPALDLDGDDHPGIAEVGQGALGLGHPDPVVVGQVPGRADTVVRRGQGRQLADGVRLVRSRDRADAPPGPPGPAGRSAARRIAGWPPRSRRRRTAVRTPIWSTTTPTSRGGRGRAPPGPSRSRRPRSARARRSTPAPRRRSRGDQRAGHPWSPTPAPTPAAASAATARPPSGSARRRAPTTPAGSGAPAAAATPPGRAKRSGTDPSREKTGR